MAKEYRLMIHPSPDIERVLSEQTAQINNQIYDKESNSVMFRVKTLKEGEAQPNPRKLTVYADGRVIEVLVPQHMSLIQELSIDESAEESLLSFLQDLASKIHPFTLVSDGVGDYGEKFTLFLGFGDIPESLSLIKSLNDGLSNYFKSEFEKRDHLHFTLVYDDADEGNIAKARDIINHNLQGLDLTVNSIWLWKNDGGWKPYREFVFASK